MSNPITPFHLDMKDVEDRLAQQYSAVLDKLQEAGKHLDATIRSQIKTVTTAEDFERGCFPYPYPELIELNDDMLSWIEQQREGLCMHRQTPLGIESYWVWKRETRAIKMTGSNLAYLNQLVENLGVSQAPENAGVVVFPNPIRMPELFAHVKSHTNDGLVPLVENGTAPTLESAALDNLAQWIENAILIQ